MLENVSPQGMPPPDVPQVQVGDPASDVQIQDANGQPVRLADFWRAKPVVLVFSRHLG